MSNKTTFWKFIKENKIEIPIIQRDYAQGRDGKEELRKNFIKDLKNALTGGEQVVLDFVYGAKENDALNPIDGQQRLTTLWLLHWYIALKAEKLDEVGETLKKFTYETRVSSREFIEKLCEYRNNPDVGKLREDIENQTWFYSEWKQDPTIKAMLTMISGNNEKDEKGNEIDGDGFEEAFTKDEDFKKYWENLTEKETIVFYSLPLENFVLSDDLYIKMNARGKELTSFENFKADLIDYITKQEKYNQEWKEKNFLDPINGIPIKMDTTWTDIFWKNNKDGSIDEIYFKFLNNFFLNELLITQNNKNDDEANNNKTYKYLSEDSKKYTGFDIYKFLDNGIPISLFEELQTILDNYYEFSKKYKIPECPWDKDFYFIPKFKDGSVSTLTQVQIVVFFAVYKFFYEYNKENNIETAINKWMRVVWNLVSVRTADGLPYIRSVAAMTEAIRKINELDSQNIYNSLLNYKNELKNSLFDDQLKEEIEKANKIKEDSSWEKTIKEVEKYAFFNGGIRFLFRDENGNWDWNNFETKWGKAQEYFDENGVKENYKELLRFFISKFNNSEQLRGIVYDNGWQSWQNNLMSKKLLVAPIHELLMADKIEIDTNFKSKLEYEGLRRVQEELVTTNLLSAGGLDSEGHWYYDIKKGCTLHWRYDNYAIFPHRANADWKKYVIANNRNQILSSIYGGKKDAENKLENKIYTNQKLEGCDFFWGWDIEFEFKGCRYFWRWNGKISKWEDNDWKDLFSDSEIKDGNDLIQNLLSQQ